MPPDDSSIADGTAKLTDMSMSAGPACASTVVTSSMPLHFQKQDPKMTAAAAAAA
eukprot:CAMPEP_0204077030 /NCGR_PEP_ID=MMETSP0360-20130528/168758_1 /ASSEMBLY_ACC=CAM_ASM_000342 /TAXON_ID=268821 /ORGANISM="Scrippsiella Hangoei, Strain SHTV-5" /LENGTH=54 /DNA_ID=CAMNT_0051025615 /DNA_START=125 /DNA_END=287 /DNA_ORIENTATION=+